MGLRPTEFRYRENLHSAKGRRMRRAGRALLGFDPAASEAMVRGFAASYYDADPLAEALAAATYLERGFDYGRAMLAAALEGGVESVSDAPASLAAMFADIEDDPSWLDWARVEQGARVFRRYGTDMFRFAGAITLEGYAENSVAKPLALTGAYAGASTRRRFLETASFWIDVSEPGGLRPGAAGRAVALRVRMMHVFVRRRLLAHPEWDSVAWGVPISQGDSTLTLMGGSFVPGVAMRVLGYRPSEGDILAMMHFWRYVGHLMGVRPTWYPESLQDAWRLMFAASVKGVRGAGADWQQLCTSYSAAFESEPESEPEGLAQRMRLGWDRGMHRGFTQLFMPPWSYRQNGLPGAGAWPLAPLSRAPLVFVAESLRRAIPSLEQVADRVARRERRDWLQRHLGREKARFRPVDQFTR
jgi:hypothetical protein